MSAAVKCVLSFALFVAGLSAVTAALASLPSNRDPGIGRPDVVQTTEKPACWNVEARMRVLVGKDGKTKVVSRFSVWAPC